jgi:hypothetical protein
MIQTKVLSEPALEIKVYKTGDLVYIDSQICIVVNVELRGLENNVVDTKYRVLALTDHPDFDMKKNELDILVVRSNEMLLFDGDLSISNDTGISGGIRIVIDKSLFVTVLLFENWKGIVIESKTENFVYGSVFEWNAPNVKFETYNHEVILHNDKF